MPASKTKIAAGKAPSGRKVGRPKESKASALKQPGKPSRSAEKLLGQPIFELEKLGKGE